VRRFQPIQVEEPTLEQTVTILRGLKRRYEGHHGIRIADSALIAAAKFGDRYITDRHLPDKAIDLIDEAASRLKIELNSRPVQLDIQERRNLDLKVELSAIETETSEDARETRTKLKRELDASELSLAATKERWAKEKEVFAKIKTLETQLDIVERKLQEARKANDLEKITEYQYGAKGKLERELEEQNAALALVQKDGSLLRQQIEDRDVAAVVSAITGIPVTSMLQSEREKLLHMEPRLTERVVGQPQAIAAVAKAVRMSRAGVNNPNQPIGSFLFVGPTGVGKTELAKALALFLFDSEEALVRIDMSEYQEQAKVNTLIGSARGYVGSEKGGILTEAVRRRPYSVVLFDEAEKAHPKVFDLLLQVLDEGRLTDSQGLQVNFTNTIVIMTSNVGSRQILDMTGKLTNEEMEVEVRKLLKDNFKPEFINRIQDIVVFNALQRQAIRLIVDIQLKKLNQLLREQKLALDVDEEAREWLADAGFDIEYGARPLKRAVLFHVQDPLSMSILEGKFNPGDTIKVQVDKEIGGLTFNRDPNAARVTA
jgi:ATP-dependent Clp protease ATP-binding subunit ClpB